MAARSKNRAALHACYVECAEVATFGGLFWRTTGDDDDCDDGARLPRPVNMGRMPAKVSLLGN